METPVFTHITADDLNFVYEPSEDTFLLLDALSEDISFINNINPAICLEIGSGSGVVITALANYFPFSSHFAIDVNPKACLITRSTSERNGCHVEVINSDLISAIRLNRIVDLIVFNPPYVVTDSEEVKGEGPDGVLARSWAGGIEGREVMDRLFPYISKILSVNGLFYLVVIAENKPKEIEKLMYHFGFKMVVIKERKVRGEHLFVLRFNRKDTV